MDENNDGNSLNFPELDFALKTINESYDSSKDPIALAHAKAQYDLAQILCNKKPKQISETGYLAINFAANIMLEYAGALARSVRNPTAYYKVVDDITEYAKQAFNAGLLTGRGGRG